jgi:hypothetical protein
MATGKIGHYTIVSELGRGGMGVVYKAHEESLNRYVAIKVLGEQLSGDPSFVTRFVREAQAAAALSHPNIIQIFFIGEDNGRHYFVMEYVKGKSLLAMVKDEGRIDNPRAAQYILQAANGLAAAHDRGFLHRDIKPANLLVEESGLLKIADFGLALPQDAATRLTATGMLVGTPGYLSPEQCMAQQVDARTDIYSLGVTYYEVLSGKMPFQADSPLALLRKILQEEPPDIATLNQAVDEETRRIVHRMIAKDREQRYQTCHELVSDLEASLTAMGARVAPSGLAGARREPAPPSAFDLAGATERMPSGAPPPGTAQGGSVFPVQQSAAPKSAPPAAPSVAAAPAPGPASTSPVPPGALVPAPQAMPVPAHAAQRSNAPLVIAAVAAFLLVAVAGGFFFALRSPLVRRFLPWGARAQVTGQAASAAPVGNEVSTTTAGQTGQPAPPAAPPQPASPQAGAEAPAAGASASAHPGNSRAREERPLVALREERRAARRAAQGGFTAPAPDAREADRSAAPALSGVAVAAVGEQILLGTVASTLENALQAAGIQALDAAALPETEGLVRPGADPPALDLLRAMHAAGVAVLVLARVEPAGQRELQYMGRYDVAYSSRVTVTCYDVATGRPRGHPLSTTVEYTMLTMERSADKALSPIAQEIAQQAR